MDFVYGANQRKFSSPQKPTLFFHDCLGHVEKRLKKEFSAKRQCPCYGLIAMIPAFHFMDLHWIIEMRVEQAAKRGRDAGTANCKA